MSAPQLGTCTLSCGRGSLHGHLLCGACAAPVVPLPALGSSPLSQVLRVASSPHQGPVAVRTPGAECPWGSQEPWEAQSQAAGKGWVRRRKQRGERSQRHARTCTVGQHGENKTLSLLTNDLESPGRVAQACTSTGHDRPQGPGQGRGHGSGWGLWSQKHPEIPAGPSSGGPPAPWAVL